ncbi:MAG: F0F1 ATP synthase subunit B [Nitrospirae bacterium]|nr:F0F1 ATP synthase subunit B [Nitrospirota bacterium]
MKTTQNSKLKTQNCGKKHLFNKMFLNFAFCFLSFAFAAASFASEGAEHAGFTWKDWLWPVVNFTVLVVVLVKFLAKPAREFFQKRTEMIEKSIKDAEEAKALAQKSLNEVKERLRDADREIGEILEAAKKSGEKEKEAIIAEGEVLKAKIIEQAKANIEFELQKAKEAIKSEAAIMALELAEKEIKARLGKKEHESLIDEYIKKLEVRN